MFAKFTKPTHRAKTIIFRQIEWQGGVIPVLIHPYCYSQAALVTMRNGSFYLLCRVGDLRPTHLIGKSPLGSQSSIYWLSPNVVRSETFFFIPVYHHILTPTLSESHVSAYVVREEETSEGEVIPHHLCAIEFGTDLDGGQDFFQLFWPLVLAHRIDEMSPLWTVSPETLRTEKLEIILTLEGTTPETGNNIQVKTLCVEFF